MAYGEIGGWKVGARRRRRRRCLRRCRGRWIAANDAELGGRHRFRGLEAEIAFLIGKDLPPREKPYSRDEVVAAIASCHPAIEVIESGLTDPLKAARVVDDRRSADAWRVCVWRGGGGLAEDRLFEGACRARRRWRGAGGTDGVEYRQAI